MNEAIANINWTAFNLAILIGLAIMGAHGFVMFCGNKRIERKHKEWERRCRKLRGEIWADLQRQIDAYRKPDGYVDYEDYKRVMLKAGERK